MTILKNSIVISLLLISQQIKSQPIYLGFNPLLKEQNNDQIKSCLLLLEKYFININDPIRYQLWNSLDLNSLSSPDRYLKYYGYSAYYRDPDYYQPTVLSIIKDSDKTYKAFISFSKCTSQGIPVVSAIISVIIVDVEGELKVTNTLLYNLEKYKWQENIRNGITFRTSPKIAFESKEALELVKFNSTISDLFETEPLRFRYVACSTFEEMQKVRGIDFDLSAQSGGIAQTDVDNSIIYVSNGKLNYFHEVVHLYYYQSYLKTNCYSEFWNEGLATYLGGSMNQSLTWHINQIRKTMAFKKYDFTDLENLKSIDVLDSTNMSYVVAAILCRSIFNKSGKSGLEKILLIDSIEKSYDLIQNELGISKSQLNEYIKSEIEEQ